MTTTASEQNIRISRHYDENIEFLKRELGIAKSFDVVLREFRIAGKRAAIVFLNGMVNDVVMTEVMETFFEADRGDLAGRTLERLLEGQIAHLQVEPVENFDEAIFNILSGPVALFVDGVDKAVIIDARSYPARAPKEPDTERVVRGSRDGFTETLVVNTGLIRRRIRDPQMRTEILQVGTRSKTNVCLCYIADIANPDLVNKIRYRLEDIKVDGIPMAEKSVEEFLTTNNWNPYPQVRYTERPDVAAIHLLEGHILVIVDTSPSVIILPVTLFHHVQHAEEYRNNAFIGTWLRWVRFAAVVASVFLLPLWLLVSIQPELLPPALQFIGPKKVGNIPLALQFIIAEIGVDMIRLSSIHTPTPLATSLGLIAAVLIGQVAIAVGLFTPEAILYLAFAAVGMFATPSYELSLANRVVRLALLIMVGLFGLPGFIIGTLGVLALLLTTRPFGVPYLWPLIPLNWAALKTIIIRSPVPMTKFRPSFLRPLDRRRQPSPALKRFRERRQRDKE